MWTAERLLKWLLLACGAGCMCGLPGLFMPRSWMAAAHEWLGMGRFPDQPIAEYLARLTSGLYAIYGLLVVLMAADVRRHARLITAQAVAMLVLALSAGCFGWPGGIPKWWIAGDIGSTAFLAAAVLFLQFRMRAADRKANQG